MNIRRLLPIFTLCLLIACQKDFDEVNDTRQRWVEFTFDPCDYFSDILIASEQGFELGSLTELEDGYGLRIVGYCYDTDSILVTKNTVFGDLQHELTLKFKHLDGDTQHHFLFIADVVKYDSDVDYYETWYQLATNNLNSFYLVSFDRDETATHNAILTCNMDVTPTNQVVETQFQPITYNGYCIFTGLDGLNKIDVTTQYYQSFFILDTFGKELASNINDFSCEGVDSIILPITGCHADQHLQFVIKKYLNGGSSSAITTLDNHCRPFLATFNCQTLTLTNLTIY